MPQALLPPSVQTTDQVLAWVCTRLRCNPTEHAWARWWLLDCYLPRPGLVYDPEAAAQALWAEVQLLRARRRRAAESRGDCFSAN